MSDKKPKAKTPTSKAAKKPDPMAALAKRFKKIETGLKGIGEVLVALDALVDALRPTLPESVTDEADNLKAKIKALADG